MLRPGLVSVTYRALAPREIVSACVQSQLEGIEWGGDVHAPPDDLKNARQVGAMTRDAGLAVAAYGSYYRCDDTPFEPILETALALGAPVVRVWAGKTDAKDAQAADWQRVSEQLRRACELAHGAGVQVATEFHGGTLTATGASARRLLDEVGDGLRTLWQPLRIGDNFDRMIPENLVELGAVAASLSHVHVYEWANDENGKRQRLALQNSEQWPRYVEALDKIGGERWLLLEFVPDDAANVLTREAAALREFIGDLS